MASWDVLWPFVVAAFAMAAAPGPSMAFIAARALAGGTGAGLRAALGVHLGSYLHVGLAAAGLAALLAEAPALATPLRLGGAAYLAWIGVSTLRGPAAAPAGGEGGAVGQGALIEALNPGTALMFLAFLPAFADPAAAWPLWAQLCVLGVALNAICTLGDVAAALAAGAASARLAAGGGVARWGAGAGLLGLAAHVAAFG